MNPWLGKALYLAAVVASIAIRVPHDKRSREVNIAQSRRGALEVVLLGLMSVGVMVLPLVYIATHLLSFADYPQSPWGFALGVALMPLWLWLFYRSHADLGTNWSMSLDVREHHRLVDSGVYARVRHPMYLALYVEAVVQVLLLANWIAGPAMFVAFSLMFFLRLGPEERLMRDTFGKDYEAYASRTKRLMPGIW